MAKSKKSTEETSAQQPDRQDATVTDATGANQEPEQGETAAEAAPDLETRLAETEELVRKNWDLYLRSQAELDNYRKRAQRDRQDLLKFGNETILREMLPVIDNLDRAVQHAREAGGEEQGLLKGVEMTLGQFRRVLEKFQVTSFDALGEKFDPARHEAMGQHETSEYPPNVVAQELQKGYLLHDRLLRPAMVLIAKAPADTKDQETSQGQSEQKA